MGGSWKNVALASVVAALVASAPVRAEEPGFSDLELFTDGQGHYIAYRLSIRQRDESGRMTGAPASYFLIGNGRVFHKLNVSGLSPVDDPRSDFVGNFVDARFLSANPRAKPNYWRRQSLKRTGKKLVVQCGRTAKKTFVPVSGKRRAAIAARAKIDWPRSRVPTLLARDDRGRYFYVDHHPDATGRRYDRRLYIGRRGRIKRARMKDVVVDDAGYLYVAKSGSLKVTGTGKEPESAVWLPTSKGPKLELTLVSVHSPRTADFIYNELGVYLGKPLGTPCDWL